MGPFPHDAPRACITEHNPAGTDGFGFVEYAHPEPEKLHALFRQMGFTAVAKSSQAMVAPTSSIVTRRRAARSV